MPFPANWLEELVVEWLDLDGFAISTAVVVPAGRGGRWAPDVVGAKLEDGRLLIRHCEATMALAQGPHNAVSSFKGKFSEDVEGEVRKYFSQIFGEAAEDKERTEYQKWLITCSDSVIVRRALEAEFPGIQVHILKRFLSEMVLPTIRRWKRGKSRATLPSDKWLLHMIDVFDRYGCWPPTG
jgi:hypothetical protein